VLNALCGQAVGSGKKKVAGVWLQQSLFWLGISMLPFLVGFFFVKDILKLLVGWCTLKQVLKAHHFSA